jgi:hypothetical protein
MTNKIEYTVDAKGTIVLPPGPPFDGKPVLIKLASGWVEAWWDGIDDGREDWFSWVCLDDMFSEELDSTKEWAPLP